LLSYIRLELGIRHFKVLHWNVCCIFSLVGNDLFNAKSYISRPLKIQIWKIIFVLIHNNMVTVQTVSV